MITLFTRSYNKDFEWLSYSIKSMKKNLLGIDHKVLVVPKDHIPSQDIIDFYDNIHYVTELHNEGYIAQQLDKIRAYEFTDSEYILFSDSDCIYYKPFNPVIDRFLDGKILLPVTPYSDLSGQVLIWKTITKKIFGKEPTLEYMRMFPILHHRSVCESVMPLVLQYTSTLKDWHLSEFNAMGFQADLYYPNLYHFKLADYKAMNAAKQYWSWGGINDTIQKELNTI